MSENQRPQLLNAFNAMKKLGLRAERVKPVLKRLLKLYNKNWELIEEDNYRTLADAIFECEEEVKPEIKPAVEEDLPEQQLNNHPGTDQPAVEINPPAPPHKKRHRIETQDAASSTMDSGNMVDKKNSETPRSSFAGQLGAFTVPSPRAPKFEATSSSACETPRSSFAGQSGAFVVPSPRAPKVEASSTSACERPRNNGNDPIKVNLSSMDQHVASRSRAGSEARQVSNEHVQGADNGNVTGNVTAPLTSSISDISKETERVKISLVNEISGSKEPLPDFVYMPSNIVYQSAYINVSLARIADEDCCSGCKGNCLSADVPCACARDTGGEFAYTPEGLVKEEFLKKCILMNENPQKHDFFYCEDCPLERAKTDRRNKKCKGHLIRRFIKECWRKCGCNMSCGNRVVQRGISRKLQVFLTSNGKGWGVRTLEVLPKGAFVCEYAGEILTNTELFERNKQNSKDRHTYPVLLDADWGSESSLGDEDALCLDATYNGNVARFINHRCCDATLTEIPVEVESPDHHYYHLAFFTKRKVNAFEELTWDYQIDFDDQNHPIKAFRCTCGSPRCRDKKGKGVGAKFSKLSRQASKGTIIVPPSN